MGIFPTPKGFWPTLPPLKEDEDIPSINPILLSIRTGYVRKVFEDNPYWCTFGGSLIAGRVLPITVAQIRVGNAQWLAEMSNFKLFIVGTSKYTTEKLILLHKITAHHSKIILDGAPAFCTELKPVVYLTTKVVATVSGLSYYETHGGEKKVLDFLAQRYLDSVELEKRLVSAESQCRQVCFHEPKQKFQTYTVQLLKSYLENGESFVNNKLFRKYIFDHTHFFHISSPVGHIYPVTPTPEEGDVTETSSKPKPSVTVSVKTPARMM